MKPTIMPHMYIFLVPIASGKCEYAVDFTPTVHCCRWGYVTMTTAVYSLNNITLASALKSTVE